MFIKKLLILTSIMLTAILSNAQSPQPQIEGFWGVKLGESETTVVRKVRQSYPLQTTQETQTANRLELIMPSWRDWM